MSLNPNVMFSNAISGERAVQTVTYPLTGDAELDTVSGILWVIEQQAIGAPSAVRVLHYLAKRFEVQADLAKFQHNSFSDLLEKCKRDAMMNPTPSNPTPGPWSTSDGSLTPSYLTQQAAPGIANGPPTSSP